MGARALWLSGASGQVIVDNGISRDRGYHDGGDDNIYIMMQCLSVCNEK